MENSSSSSCSLIALVAVVLWSLGQSIGQEILAPSSYNCSRKYNLSLSDCGGNHCKDSCMQTEPAMAVDSCMSLLDILKMFKDNETAGDCLELVLTPGEYKLPSLSQVVINYSVVLTAPEGGVTFSCTDTDKSETVEEVNEMIHFSEVNFVKMENINFKYCARKFCFNELKFLSINSCTFIGFTASALDIFNVEIIKIENSTFQDCVSSNGSKQFRGNSGAVSIGYYKSEGNVTSATLIINNSTFINNTAHTYNINSTVENTSNLMGFFYGRGGALSIIPQRFIKVKGGISNTSFLRNRAKFFGGGVYLLLAGSQSQHNLLFEGCKFLHNSAGNTSFGGGIAIAFLQNIALLPMKVTFVDSYFEGNSGYFGGGLGLVQIHSQGRGNEVVLKRTHFVKNRAIGVGSALMFQTYTYMQSKIDTYFHNLTDCSFSGNDAPGGTFGAGFINMNFFGSINFTNNSGPALRLVGSLVVLSGKLSFMGNSIRSNEGGALFIQAFGQVKLRSRSEMEFINNTGRIGSAIVVNVQRSSPVFSELIYNPQCFLIHEDAKLPPSKWNDVSVKFCGNEANIGPAVYISHLLHCSWYSADKAGDFANEQNITYSIEAFSKWTAFKYDCTNKAISHADNQYDPKFYFQTEPSNITSINSEENIQIRPGQIVNLNLNGIDQFGNPTYLIARVSDGSSINTRAFSQATGNKSEETIRFVPALLPVQPDTGMADISYGFTHDIDQSELNSIEISPVIDTPFNVIKSTQLELNMTLVNCQPGFELSQTNSLITCQCVNRNFILNCEEEVIILRDGMWAVKEEEPYPHLHLRVCPTPYCRCHVRNESDDSQAVCETLYYQNGSQQCHPTRRGTLCGRCIDDKGVGVLRRDCRDCSQNSFYLLIFLVVGDISVTCFIMFAAIRLNFYFPQSLLFYAQTVYYTTEHFPIYFWDIRKYMLYLTSALELYFPYDFCLYPGMTALESFALKFIPPITAIITAGAVTVGIYVKRARNGRKHVWRALWFLILLLYAPLFHTCTSLLVCPRIPSESGDDEARHWFFDGEVVCFQDTGHIFLSLLAIPLLILLILLIPALLFIVIYSRKTQSQSLTLEWILFALTEGYRDSVEVRWWASWELLRRLLLISIVVSLPGRSVAACFVVAVSFAVHVFFNPYKKVFQNVIETFVLFNYIILLLVRSTQTFLDSFMDSSNSLDYTGTGVPSLEGDGLPQMNKITWLFFPFFYLPLFFAVVFSCGALIYRIIKWKKHRKLDQSACDEVEIDGDSSVYRKVVITTTEIDGPT